MTSPLDFIANSWLVLSSPGVPAVTNGRIVSTPGSLHAIRLYLVRQDAARTTTGWDAAGNELPGASGTVTVQRGWALGYAPWTEGAPWPASLTQLVAGQEPGWLFNGAEGTLYHGAERPKVCSVLSCYGRFGGAGIDAMVSAEVGGIPVILQAGEVIN